MQGHEKVALGSNEGVEVLIGRNAYKRTAADDGNKKNLVTGAAQIRRTASKSEDTNATEELSSESSKNMLNQDAISRRESFASRRQIGSSRSLESKSKTADQDQLRKVHSMGDLQDGGLPSASQASTARNNGRTERHMSSPGFTPFQKKQIQSPKGILTVSQPSGASQYPSMELKWQEARRKRRQSKIKNGVTFGHIEIREHPIIPGDNPGGFYGPPLSIDWVSQSKEVMKLEDYENERPPRRMGSQMNIPSTVRHEMLLNNGYTSNEIQRALKDVNIARSRRKRTIETLQLKPLQEALEKMSRGTNNLLFGRARKQKERHYIRNAMKVHMYQEPEYRGKDQQPKVDTHSEAPQTETNVATETPRNVDEIHNPGKLPKRTEANDDVSISSGEEEA